jgi:hypothetical protein
MGAYLDYFGHKTQLETMSLRQLYTLLMSALVSYFVMLLCGTLGAPQHISHIVTTCDSSSIQACLTQGIQICEVSSSS